MTAPIAPAQGSNVRDSPGVETSPRGWHTIFLPPVPKKVRPLLPRPCLYLLLPPQRTDTCLAAAFFFPCWVAGGGHTTTTTLAKGRMYSLAGGHPGASAREGEGPETPLSWYSKHCSSNRFGWASCPLLCHLVFL